ncbi:hypothetical protein FGO68_gene12707 [Halteria grandinella]|uniref:Uncharacterized protein n=1 Tax=Halteria grandinella TaxID=5974 RepID=A0A8J8NX63_HALGN|nr:hypothetical protein FGO68_gene12707 [Halteria grandinella]
MHFLPSLAALKELVSSQFPLAISKRTIKLKQAHKLMHQRIFFMMKSESRRVYMKRWSLKLKRQVLIYLNFNSFLDKYKIQQMILKFYRRSQHPSPQTSFTKRC